jgi:hypothetical protein
LETLLSFWGKEPIEVKASFFRFALAIVAVAIGSCFSVHAGSLEGLSIDVRWSTITTFRRDGVTRTTPTENRGLKMYIGLGGHVFEYGGFRDFWGQSVAGVGKARQTRGNEMEATAVASGQVTRIFKLTRGFMIQTINVSAAHDSCTFAEDYKPDAEGKLIGFDPYTQRPFELISRTFKSNTCAVTEGNIFLNDHR